MFERRSGSLEHPNTPLTSDAIVAALGGTMTNDAGVTVNETAAMKQSAVFRCASLVSSVSASLPLPVYRSGTRERVTSALLAAPHPDLTAYDLWALAYVHRCLWGNAYLQKVRDNAGQVRELWPIHPARVRPKRIRPSEANPGGKVFEVDDEWGGQHLLTSRDIFHIPGLGFDGVAGVSVVKYAAQAVGLALAAEKYGAKLFGSGNLLSGYLTTEQDIDDEDAIRLQGRWRQKMAGLDRAHEVPVLDKSAKFVSMTMPNDDAQLLESRHFEIADISRYFGVPPFLLNETEKSTSWGTGLEQQAQGWVTFDLHPRWLAPHEARVTRELVPDGQSAKYKLQGLLRGDSQARAELYRTLRELGGLSANDMRELEDEPPVEGGDQYLQPMNLVPLGTTPTTTDQGTQSPTREGGSDAPDADG